VVKITVLSVGIKYSMRDVMCGVNYYAHNPRSYDMGK